MDSGALFSLCKTWRYRLWRIWDEDGPAVNVIGLNPSTATETIDDPTIRRCIRYAKNWGYGGLEMTNLYGYRSTDPKRLWAAADPYGPDNLHHILQQGMHAGLVIAAWGVPAGGRERWSAAVLHALRDAGIVVHCLKRTAGGHPAHPLYLRADLMPVVF